jgi:hypothetical protein
MRTVTTRAGLALVLLLGGAAAWAQDKKPPPPPDEPTVHRMEIYNGPVRSVHYISRNLSAGDQATLRELEHAENEVAIAGNLEALRLQYVVDEQAQQAHRRHLQQLLYGYSSETTADLSFVGGYRPYGWYGGYGAGYLAAPYYFGGPGAFASFTATASHSLANGVGDEGVLKAEIARSIGGEAVPDAGARANAGLTAALARAGQSGSLRTALGIREGKEPISTVAFETLVPGTPGIAAGAPVVVTRTHDGKSEKVEGNFVNADKDWLVVQTKEGRLHIPRSQVSDILERPAK